MSEGDVEIIRDQFAAVNERDFERAMASYTDDAVLVAHGFLNSGKHEGRDAVGEWFGDWFRTFGHGYQLEIDEERDLGERIFIHAVHGGHGRASGVEVAGETAYLYSVRGEKVARVEVFNDRKEALEAAGLSE